MANKEIEIELKKTTKSVSHQFEKLKKRANPRKLKQTMTSKGLHSTATVNQTKFSLTSNEKGKQKVKTIGIHVFWNAKKHFFNINDKFDLCT